MAVAVCRRVEGGGRWWSGEWVRWGVVSGEAGGAVCKGEVNCL